MYRYIYNRPSSLQELLSELTKRSPQLPQTFLNHHQYSPVIRRHFLLSPREPQNAPISNEERRDMCTVYGQHTRHLKYTNHHCRDHLQRFERRSRTGCASLSHGVQKLTASFPQHRRLSVAGKRPEGEQPQSNTCGCNTLQKCLPVIGKPPSG